jgi:hypothetical protein
VSAGKEAVCHQAQTSRSLLVSGVPIHRAVVDVRAGYRRDSHGLAAGLRRGRARYRRLRTHGLSRSSGSNFVELVSIFDATGPVIGR